MNELLLLFAGDRSVYVSAIDSSVGNVYKSYSFKFLAAQYLNDYNEYDLLDMDCWNLGNNIKSMCRPVWISDKTPDSQTINMCSNLQ